MFTTIKTKEGQEINITTQQYVVGLYVIINNDPSQQFGVNTDETKYHKDIRIKCIKNGDTLVGGSVLDVKSKFPINTFSNN